MMLNFPLVLLFLLLLLLFDIFALITWFFP